MRYFSGLRRGSRSWWAVPAFPRGVVIAALCAMPGGCQSPRDDSGPPLDVVIPLESGTSPDLLVVHVCAEGGFRAGAPIGGTRVVTIQCHEDLAMLYAVVDGLPMVWYRPPGETWDSPGNDPAGYPKHRTLMGWPMDAESNLECVDPRVTSGRELSIGGFFFENIETPRDFWKVPVSVVSAAIADPPDPLKQSLRDGMFVLSVSPGDYHGFVGGPVAVRNDEGRFEVIGVVVSQPTDASDGARLIAQTLAAGRAGEKP